MTQPTEPVKTDKKPGTPLASSPKPKPAKTENVNKALSVNSLRLAPFEAYTRTDRAPAGGSGAAQGEGFTGTKPFAKKRL
ncbi:MAG: hypothetical protein FDX30_05135 [Chlorobium sp.]|nr:MAG: hypothetical protein FDX30_05135 [Chlorobium sp.]